MAYPRMEKYAEAMQHHQKFLTDPELKNGILKKSGMGLPIAISGGFALTYTIRTQQKIYAVRCFHKESKSLEERYQGISEKLQSLQSEYFLNFEYQKQGILVEGKHYPIVKMTWADGVTLGEFIENNLHNQVALSNLLHSILKLASYLEKQHIAHGDIQTGNMMVSQEGKKIQLIDYDGFYIDSISHLGSAEVGHINFQHPIRARQNPFNAQNDRFSLIVIWLALATLLEDESIWQKTKSDVDTFIFRANDFNAPTQSKTFQLLKSYSNLKSYIDQFESICQTPNLKDIPTLNQFIQHQYLASTLIQVSPVKQINHYISQYPVLAADDYQSCFEQCGNQVEVIGKITDVKLGCGVNKKPYIFINFGHWKGKIFKINIWSEGINKLNIKPDKSWVGKWLSVRGLMENPYYSTKFGYTHIAITITKNGQMKLIDQDEAQFRLTPPPPVKPIIISPPTEIKPSIPEPFPIQTNNLSDPKLKEEKGSEPLSTTKNTEVLNKIRQANREPSTPTIKKSISSTPTRINSLNHGILDEIRKSNVKAKKTSARCRPMPPPQSNTITTTAIYKKAMKPKTTQPTKKNSYDNDSMFLLWVFLAILLTIVVKSCSMISTFIF